MSAHMSPLPTSPAWFPAWRVAWRRGWSLEASSPPGEGWRFTATRLDDGATLTWGAWAAVEAWVRAGCNGPRVVQLRLWDERRAA